MEIWIGLLKKMEWRSRKHRRKGEKIYIKEWIDEEGLSRIWNVEKKSVKIPSK